MIYGFMVKDEFYSTEDNKTIKAGFDTKSLMTTFMMHKRINGTLVPRPVYKSDLIVITEKNMEEFSEFFI